MNKLFFLITILFTICANANFEELAKKTSSTFSIVTDVDSQNAFSMSFETLLTSQKVYLLLSSTHLNSSFYTIVNSDSEAKLKKIVAPEIHINNLLVRIDSAETEPDSCDGSDVQTSDVSCETRQCTISQRIISQCNIDDCWKTDAATDRDISLPLSEAFSLKSKINISDCVVNNIAGQKHELSMSVTNQSASILNGGTIQASLILQNDVVE